MNGKPDIEISNTTYQGHFPEELPPRPQPASRPWRHRMRAFFTFSLSSFSLIHTPNEAARLRHIAMIVILLLRSAMSALSILSSVIAGNVAGIVIYSLLAVASVWFTATCLAIIGDAAGNTNVEFKVIKRWYFDVFLGFCVLIHAGLIVAWFFGLTGWGLELTGIAMWFAILGVAWIAGWQPDVPQYQKVWFPGRESRQVSVA